MSSFLLSFRVKAQGEGEADVLKVRTQMARHLITGVKHGACVSVFVPACCVTGVHVCPSAAVEGSGEEEKDAFHNQRKQLH